jgi:hypothetical protein
MNSYRSVRTKRGSRVAWGVEHHRAGSLPRVIQEFWTLEEAEAAVQALTSIEMANRRCASRTEGVLMPTEF